MRKTESGSAHLVIVIIFSLAIIGLLGFVLWQNFTQNNNDNSNNKASQPSSQSKPATKTTDDEVALTETAADDLVGTGLAIKYPKTWSMTQDSSSEGSGNTAVVGKVYTINSPDSNLSVKFTVSNIGGGGMCDPVDGDAIVQLDKSAIPGFSKVQFISYSSNNGTFFAGVENNNEKVNSAKIGDSSCSTATFGGQSGVIENIANSRSLENVNLLLRISFNKIKYDSSSNASELFRQTLTTENYKTAKRIIESLYIKE